MKKDSLQLIVKPLLKWYAQNARVLPWRDDPTPYRVLISEIMLQQTRVETVIPYFERFIRELPDIRALAETDEQNLLKLWEGLGYYSRARNLQKAARMVMQEYGGNIPSGFSDLVRLPGIGTYTAGAVSSIAFGIPLPAVDGNVLRVVSRITASRENVSDPAVKRSVEDSIRIIIPPGQAGDFSQALMELGATVCLPNGEPKCESCPLGHVCAGYAQGVAATLPVKAHKAERKIQNKTVFIMVNGSRLAIRQNPQNGLLAGLWGLPVENGVQTPDEAARTLAVMGVSAGEIKPLFAAKHIFTHIEWRMTGYFAQISEIPENSPFTWASPAEIKNRYALPSAYRKYVSWFLKHYDKPWQ
jgi:A/G-specific adenine glycosylase